MVYGRYNELVHGGYNQVITVITVYKPTNITAEPHPVVNLDQLVKTNI